VLTVLAFAVYVLVQWLELKALTQYNLAAPGD
jgi:hypothetical protein